MHIHASVKRITGINNKEEDSASRLTHLTFQNFLQHFQSILPQILPWMLCLLPCVARRRLRTMLHTRLFQRPLLFQDPQGHHGLEAMVQLLLMAPYPTRLPWHQVPRAIPSNIRSQGTHISPCSQEEGHSKTKRGSINPLHGGPRPRFSIVGSINFFLGQQLAAYKREDPPLTRVCPLPISVLRTLNSAAQVGSNRQQAISDLAWIAFFFLLWPSEYCQGVTDTVSTPFRLWYIHFFIGNQPTPATTATPQECAAATFISILFTTQKNGVKGESIGHGTTGHPRACAVAAIRRRVAYLQHHSVTSHTPLASVFHKNKLT